VCISTLYQTLKINNFQLENPFVIFNGQEDREDIEKFIYIYFSGLVLLSIRLSERKRQSAFAPDTLL